VEKPEYGGTREQYRREMEFVAKGRRGGKLRIKNWALIKKASLPGVQRWGRPRNRKTWRTWGEKNKGVTVGGKWWMEENFLVIISGDVLAWVRDREEGKKTQTG